MPSAGIELRRTAVSDLSQQKLQTLIELEAYEDDVVLIADAVSDEEAPQAPLRVLRHR
jgi:hypothetical protein